MTQVDFAIITIRPNEFATMLQRSHTQVHNSHRRRTNGISQVHTNTGKTG